MRQWNTPFINSFHALALVANLVMGVFDLLHHYVAPGICSLVLAACIVAVNIVLARSRRRLGVLREQVRQLHLRQQGMDGMIFEEVMKAEELAKASLRQVAHNLGATVTKDCGRAEIRIGRYWYYVKGHEIDRSDGTGKIESTCLQGGTMPYPEQIASVLLLLKNDPTIFTRWQRHDNYYA